MESLKGKFLIRRAKLCNEEVVVVAGVAFCPTIKQIDAGDELWVAEFLLSDVMKFKGFDHKSPTWNKGIEEFIAGFGQNVREWEGKGERERLYLDKLREKED
jgi:hypothetical protein